MSSVSFAKRLRNMSTPRVIVYALIFAMIAVTSHLAYTMHREYEADLDQAEQTTKNYTIALEEHISRIIDAVDGELRAIELRLRLQPHDEQLNGLLKARTVQLPFLDFLAALGADGIGVAHSDAPIGIGADYSDRDHFRMVRDNEELSLYIGAPVQRRYVPGSLIPISRRMTGEGGRFAGVTVASLDAAFIRELLRKTDLGTRGFFAIYLNDGTILAREPEGDKWFGRSAAHLQLFTSRLPTASSGTFRTGHLVDGVERIVSYRKLTNYPLVVATGISVDDALLGWWRRLGEYAVLWGALAVTLAVLGAMLFRFTAEREAAAAQAREAAARLRAVIDNTSDGLMIVAEDGTIENANQSARLMFGYDGNSLVGLHVRAVISSSDDLPPEASIGGVLEIPAVASSCQSVVGRHRRGSVFPAEVRLSTVKLAGKQKYIVTVLDITERVQTEEQVRQAQRLQAVGQLTGGVAHEFNNLLLVIQAGAEMLLPEVRYNATAYGIAKRIETAVGRGADLTRSLLAFSRRQFLEPKLIEIDAALKDTLALARSAIGEAIRIDVKFPAGTWAVTADPNLLNNAILNLLINARDAMPGGGLIEIETANTVIGNKNGNEHLRPGRYVAITVRDTGVGMAPEVSRKAFEPFFTTKEVGGGSGLGLSMVIGFARQSGGDALLNSVLGEGTTVTLLLPATEQAVPAETSRDQIPVHKNGGTILVVEDDAEVLATTAYRLRALGYTVVTATDGPAALAILDVTPRVDLVFTDVVMPKGMSGLDLVRRIRAQRPAIRVIYTSGYRDNVIPGSTAGDEEIVLLRKPYTLRELAETVGGVLTPRVVKEP